MKIKEIKKGSTKVIITRTQLVDGYNYYLTVTSVNESFINENYKQLKSIISLREAEIEANTILNN